MNKLVSNRILAFAIDYLLIILYGFLLFIIAMNIEVGQLSPIKGQLLGFFSLTLPVFFYFYLMEKSSRAGTIGKQVMKIAVHAGVTAKNKKFFIRNVLKFLPWEIAHSGVHWLVFYSQQNQHPPLGVWIVLIMPQAIVFTYFISIMYFKGKSSIYDQLAKTQIQYR